MPQRRICTVFEDGSVASLVALDGFRAHSNTLMPEALALIGLMTRFAKKLMVGQPATVDLGLNSVVIRDVLYDSLFTVLESDCKVFDPGPRVQRVLTWSDCSVESDAATLIGVVEGRDLEPVAAILENPHSFEIYRRNARNKLRAEIDVRTSVAKDAMSARVITCRRAGVNDMYDAAECIHQFLQRDAELNCMR